MLAHGVNVGRLFKLLVLVYAFLDENLFERGKVQLFKQFTLSYLKLLAQEVLCVFGAVAQHVAHGEELGLIVLYDAAVRRDVHLAVGEGIERIERLVRRDARCEVHLYLHLRRRVVVNLPRLYLALLYGLEYGVDECGSGLAIRYFAYDERLVVEFLYLCPHLQHSAALPVVVSAHVDASARREVGEELEWPAVQIGHGSVAQLAEVVRKYFGRQADGNAFGALCQKQRKLDRKRYRLLVSPVVAQLPLGGLRVEHGVEGKLRQPRLDVSRCRRTVAGKDVSPVSLRIDKQVLLSQLHECVAY